MNTVGAMNVVLCGEIRDIDGQVRVPAGVCMSELELYSITWDMNNTVFEGVYTVSPPPFNDNNVKEGFVIAALFFMSFAYVLIIGCLVWIYYRRDHPVVKFAQPRFLIWVLIGCFIGISTIYPLGVTKHISDEMAYELGDDIAYITDRTADVACQSTIWLMVTGFSLTFPVLFAKTWRLHSIVKVVLKNTFNIQAKIQKIHVSRFVLIFIAIVFIPMITWQVWYGVVYIFWFHFFIFL
jgi:hypothetical protein